MGKFKELWVWKEGIELATNIYDISRKENFAKDWGINRKG